MKKGQEKLTSKHQKLFQNIKLPSLKGGKEPVANKAGLGSISVKLVIAFVIPVILILILGISSYNKASRAIIHNAEKSTTDTIYAKGTYLGLGFQGVVDRSVELLTMEDMDNFYKVKELDVNKLTDDQVGAKENIKKRIMNMQSTNNFIYNIYLIGSVGTGINTAPTTKVEKDSYNNFIQTELGKEIMDSKDTIGWFDTNQYFIDMMSKLEPKVNVSESAISFWRKAKFATTTLVFIDIKQEVVDNALAELNFEKGSYTAFIGPDGKQSIFKGTKAEAAVKTTKNDKISISDQKFYQKAVKSEKKSDAFYCTYKGVNYLFSYSKIGDTGAILCSLIPKSSITKEADSIRGLTLLITIISIIVAVIASSYMFLSMNRAVHRSIKSLEQATKGDLTVVFDTNRRDEFGIIARSSSKMLEGIRSLIVKMQSVGSKVNETAVDVSESINNLLASTKEISFAIEEIEGGVTTQAKDAEQCLIQMSGLSERINSVYDSTHEIERIADNTKSITGEGIMMMDKLNKTTKAATDMTRDIIISIEDLEVQSQSIGSIVNVINSIASQTNLLSLNASIEAARAGEAGKGFAVVAKEIRNLADQSMESSKKIEKIIEIIMDKTHKTVFSAKQAGDIIDEQNSALKQSVEAFHNISKSVESLVYNLDKISEGIKDIEDSKTDTLDAIQNISAVSEESASASEEVGATIANMVNAVSQLNEIAVELEADAKNMESAISVFKF